MARRRILYLAGVIFCLIVYVAYREWLAWVLFLSVLWLPVFSLAVSLPAMLTAKFILDTPGVMQLGQSATLAAKLGCKLPCPPVRYRFFLQEKSSGQSQILRCGTNWTPEHCGVWTVKLHRSFVYDYLGLVRLPVGKQLAATVYIEPIPVPMEIANIQGALAPKRWRPKPGGGFAENHDLRLYRPGDNLHHIHWKMAAKTGTLIYREPMVSEGEAPVLLLRLSGSRTEQDEKLGKLLWLSSYLLSRQTVHGIKCMTGSGLFSYMIHDGAGLIAALRELLQQPAAGADAAMPEAGFARCFQIGGEQDEA